MSFCDGLRLSAGIGRLQLRLGCGPVDEACAAKDHQGVLDICLYLRQIGLEHFQLKADAPCFSAQQKFGVSKGQTVCFGFEHIDATGISL